jgi:diguanylate cyclase (GGDEF)-like protein
MSLEREIPARATLDRLADESGLAIAIVDAADVEVATANNNSLCESLNPTGELQGRCRDFCGRALEKSLEAGGSVAYECHAGLECRAAAMKQDGRDVAAIVGRTFVKADRYRLATTRAIGGDWTVYPPSEFFRNILLSNSTAVIEKTLDKLIDSAEVVESPRDAIARLSAEINREPSLPFPDAPRVAASAERGEESWPAFFDSLLTQHYDAACHSILQFVEEQFSFRSAVWLERRGRRFINRAASPALRERRVRLGLAADDPRIRTAVTSGEPVELFERGGLHEATRSMLLFPVPVGNDLTAALAVVESTADLKLRRKVADFCRGLAPRIEILRLRKEVARRDALSDSVRIFGESLRGVEPQGFWNHLVASSADLLDATRASLLVVNEQSGTLEIKASHGVPSDAGNEAQPGGRVAQVVFDEGKPLLVPNIADTGLDPAPVQRGYRSDSFVSCPIMLSGRKLAVMNFTDKIDGAPFDRRDLDVIRAIGPQIAVAIDRAQLTERAGEYHQLSVTDALTGLLNRRYLDERLTEEVKRSRRHGYPMSFLMLDVDHFKSYNDEFGHPAGDEALKLVAEVIRDTLRDADVAARYGGEEFAIMLPQTTDGEAAMIAERVRANVDAAKFPHRKVTVSIGVASCTSELCANETLKAAADKALYDAKNRGRNRVRIYADMEADLFR